MWTQVYNSSIDMSGEDNLKYPISLYDACIFGIDQERIQAILDRLNALGLYHNTLIIDTGDHGEASGEHGLLGHGLQLDDEVIHVPLIMKPPKGQERREIQESVQSVDIMPTVRELVGAKVPHKVQGKSLVGLMKAGC